MKHPNKQNRIRTLLALLVLASGISGLAHSKAVIPTMNVRLSPDGTKLNILGTALSDNSDGRVYKAELYDTSTNTVLGSIDEKTLETGKGSFQFDIGITKGSNLNRLQLRAYDDAKLTPDSMTLQPIAVGTFVNPLTQSDSISSTVSVEPSADTKGPSIPNMSVFKETYNKYFGSQKKPDAKEDDFKENIMYVIDRNGDGDLQLANRAEAWVGTDYSRGIYTAEQNQKGWKGKTGVTVNFGFKDGKPWIVNAKGEFTEQLSLDPKFWYVVKGFPDWDDMCEGTMAFDSRIAKELGLKMPQGKVSYGENYSAAMQRAPKRGAAAAYTLLIFPSGVDPKKNTVTFDGNRVAIPLTDAQRDDVRNIICKAPPPPTGYVDSTPKDFAELDALYGLTNSTEKSTVTDASGLPVANGSKYLRSHGPAVQARGRITFDNLLGLYLSGYGFGRNQKGDVKSTDGNGQVSAGILRDFSGVGIGLGAGINGTSEKQSEDLGDGFNADVKRIFYGPMAEAILRLGPTETRIGASIPAKMNGNEKITVTNDAVPDYKNVTDVGAAERTLLEGSFWYKLGDFDLRLDGSKKKRIAKESETIDRFGAELDYKGWKLLNKIPLDLRVKGAIGTRKDVSYQELYGGAGFRF